MLKKKEYLLNGVNINCVTCGLGVDDQFDHTYILIYNLGAALSCFYLTIS